MKYLKTYEDMELIMKRNKMITNRFKKSAVEMNFDQCVEYIENNCTEWLENPIKIKRGIDYNYDYFYSKPVARLSKDNLNYYTLIMDNSPEWKNFPKRRKSFICKFNSSTYGNYEYYVIPEDGSNWGIVNNQDIWNGFDTSLEEIDLNYSCNRFVRNFNDVAKLYGIEVNDTNWTQFKKDIKELEIAAQYKDIIFLFDEKKIINDYIIRKGNILQNLRNIFNPVKNKFVNIHYSDIQKYPEYVDSWSECWTDSPCIFVNRYLMKKILRTIKDKKFKQKTKNWE